MRTAIVTLLMFVATTALTGFPASGATFTYQYESGTFRLWNNAFTPDDPSLPQVDLLETHMSARPLSIGTMVLNFTFRSELLPVELRDVRLVSTRSEGAPGSLRFADLSGTTLHEESFASGRPDWVRNFGPEADAWDYEIRFGATGQVTASYLYYRKDNAEAFLPTGRSFFGAASPEPLVRDGVPGTEYWEYFDGDGGDWSLVSVPLPMSGTLMTSGLAALIIVRRGKRSARS